MIPAIGRGATIERRLTHPGNQSGVRTIGSPWYSIAVASALGFVWLSACAGDLGPQLDPATVIISGPVANVAAATIAGALSSADSVYVSMAPGTIPSAVAVSIRAGGSATRFDAAFVDGGFDPVAVPAGVGQTLELLVRLRTGGTEQLMVVVPSVRPPIVVRTNPPPKKRAVALDVIVEVVLSEPAAPSSLTPTSVQLLRAGVPVAGTLAAVAGTPTTVSFAPTALLDSNTDYALVVTQEVRDLAGFPLATADTVSFTTGNGVSVPPAHDTWATMAPMPTPRCCTVAAVVGGLLYAVGGDDNGSFIGTVESYDAATDHWSARAAMPTPRCCLAGGVLNGSIYTVGGFDAANFSMTTVEAYDPVTDSWSAKAAMPTARYGSAAGVVNGILYVTGGQTTYPGPVLASTDAYDPTANRWTPKAPMPTPRVNLSVAVVNGVLYALGGYGNGNYLTTVEAYDPTTDRWTTRASMPTARSSPAIAVVNGLIYVVGGDTGVSTDTRVTEVYDPVTDTWTTKAPMITSRGAAVGAAINGVVYVIGGTNAPGTIFFNTVEAYTP